VIADPVVRNRGTIGGALCQADPSEDLSAVCAAVDARLVIRSTTRERVVDMHDFHRGPYETAVGPAEMLVEIRVPIHAHSAARTEGRPRVGDWAVVAAGASLDFHPTARSPRGPRARRRRRRHHRGHGPRRQKPSEKLFAKAAKLAQSACEPVSDQRGSADYKRHVVGVLTERVLKRATERALQTREV
jgi:carbon-monoxide dehydrogenase medium subunit